MQKVNPSTSLKINGEPFDALRLLRANGELVEPERSRTIKFYTLGCKVNQYETQAIREQFINAGFREMDNGNRADICVINTCTVTHRADADSLNYVRRARRENPSAKLIATGCLTEFDADRISRADSRCLIVKNKYKSDMLRYFFSRYPQTRKPANYIRYF